MAAYEAHPTAVIVIGDGTRIWHFTYVSTRVQLGANCTLGQSVFIAPGVRIGNNVKIQNNVSIYEGVTLDDDVFCSPSCIFTNVANPRSQIRRRGQYTTTHIARGATIGANAGHRLRHADRPLRLHRRRRVSPPTREGSGLTESTGSPGPLPKRGADRLRGATIVIGA